MRRLLLGMMVAASSVATADSTLPVDNVFGGQVDDWAIYSVERRGEDGKLTTQETVDGKPTPLRAVLKVASTPVDAKARRLVWFVGPKDREVEYWSPTFTAKLASHLAPGSSGDADVKVEPATCKLAASVPCSKVTFTDPKMSLGRQRAATTVTMTMAKQVKGSGIVDFEIKDKTGVVLRLTAIGYGHAKQSEWGAAATASALTMLIDGPARTPTSQPAMAMEDLETRGGLTQAAVRKVLDASKPKLQYCYEKQLLARATLTGGTLDLQIMIEGDGKVSSATAKGFDPEVGRCVSDVVKALGFAATKTPSLAELTLRFTRGTP